MSGSNAVLEQTLYYTALWKLQVAKEIQDKLQGAFLAGKAPCNKVQVCTPLHHPQVLSIAQHRLHLQEVGITTARNGTELMPCLQR